jgi:DNA-binding transcriptional LysR family regulator
MELRHLRYFTAVAETLHFGRAAERLHITQPALSRQIRDLEDEIGTTLLLRHGTGTTLTPAGARFLPCALEVLAAADRAVEAARSSARQLRLGHYGTLWLDHYGPALRTFAKRHPDLVLQPIELTPPELVAALRRGEIDAALVGPLDNLATTREFVVRPLGSVQALVAIGAANPLGKRRKYALEELRDARWARWDDRSFPGRTALLARAAKLAGFAPKPGQTVDSVAAMFVAVATSCDVGYVLPMSRELPHDGVVFAELKPPGIAIEMNIAWRRGAANDNRLQELANALGR